MAEFVDELSQEKGGFGDIVRRPRLAASDPDEARWAAEFERFPFYGKADLAAGAVSINNRTGHVLRPAVLATLVRPECEKGHPPAHVRLLSSVARCRDDRF